jgi:hypothetical protein
MMRSLCMRLQMSRNCSARSPSYIWKRPARAARTTSPARAEQTCARMVARGRYLVTLLSGSLVRHARHVASAHAQRADGERPRTCQPGSRDGRPRESCHTGQVGQWHVTGRRRKGTRTAPAPPRSLVTHRGLGRPGSEGGILWETDPGAARKRRRHSRQ